MSAAWGLFRYQLFGVVPIAREMVVDSMSDGVLVLAHDPLLNRDIVDIAAHASPDMAVKLFTTGVGLTPSLARDLAAAGVFSVCVSLDHWEAGRHNASRRYPRAFEEAIEAIRILKEVSGLHVSVSSLERGQDFRARSS